jgi:hypothetical protein
MAAGSVAAPRLIPLRAPGHGRAGHEVDTATPVEMKSGTDKSFFTTFLSSSNTSFFTVLFSSKTIFMLCLCQQDGKIDQPSNGFYV